MIRRYIILALLVALDVVNSAVLLWGPKEVQIPALKTFDNEDLKNLLSKIDNPQIIAFGSKSTSAANNINRLFTNQTTAYVPNSIISIDNLHELTGDETVDFKIIQNALQKSKAKIGFNRIVALIINEGARVRRQADIPETQLTSTTESAEAPYLEPVSGPILYSAVLSSDKNMEAMLYSSKPPLLKTNASLINLGEATLSNLDTRNEYTRLSATIPVENGKIILRFKFPWLSDYWYLTSVEIEFVDTQAKKYNLSLKQDVTAPRRFSYHCGGEIVFSNVDNDIELRLFEVQAQPDAHSHRFNDAYNCVPFTTGPIWSGIFVTFVLAAGLAVGLSALGSIKTMDKFDNYKTKQLSITVWE